MVALAGFQECSEILLVARSHGQKVTVKSCTHMHDECLHELHREDLLILGTMQPQTK